MKENGRKAILFVSLILSVINHLGAYNCVKANLCTRRLTKKFKLPTLTSCCDDCRRDLCMKCIKDEKCHPCEQEDCETTITIHNHCQCKVCVASDREDNQKSEEDDHESFLKRILKVIGKHMK